MGPKKSIRKTPWHYLLLLLLIFCSIYSMGITDTPEEENHHNIILGERLFYGQKQFSSGFHNCQRCHYTVTSDSINWNPAAWELTNSKHVSDSTTFIKMMAQPTSIRMAEAHQGMRITAQEAILLKAYLTQSHHTGVIQHKPFPKKLILFLLSGAIMAMMLIELLFLHKIKIKAIPGIILLMALALHIKVISHEAIDLGRTKDYAPDQPIKFSHALHAGENQINCRYCHTSADRSKSAGIPSTQLCLNCHGAILNGTNTGKHEINKIHQSLQDSLPIRWIRIHNLPDHAYFNHAQHTMVASLACEKCHGEVSTMHIMTQAEDLSMGWCINCHRNEAVHFKDNEYYKTWIKLQKQTSDTITAAETGGLDCSKCHY